jgi:MoaA/NifB/PqqE/SkfB family radical SAM enzyme
MCGQAARKTEVPETHRAELCCDEWKSCIDNIKDSFFIRPRIHLTGGEPLLVTRIDDLIQHAVRKGFKTSLTTNGILLSKHAEVLASQGISNVNVSIHGPRDIHDLITGMPGSFARAMEGVGMLRRLGSACPEGPPRICINCVINGHNYDALEETIRCVQPSGADAISFQHLSFSSQDVGNEFCQVNVERLMAQIRRIREKQHGMRVLFYPRVQREDLTAYYGDLSHNFGQVCIAPWFIMRVGPNGDVHPCLRHTCGNLRTDTCPLRSIWNNVEFRRFRRMLKSGLFPGCVRCCHRQYSSAR